MRAYTIDEKMPYRMNGQPISVTPRELIHTNGKTYIEVEGIRYEVVYDYARETGRTL